jgi:hypothetical protein
MKFLPHVIVITLSMTGLNVDETCVFGKNGQGWLIGYDFLPGYHLCWTIARLCF